jgi:hypothetical protein
MLNVFQNIFCFGTFDKFSFSFFYKIFVPNLLKKLFHNFFASKLLQKKLLCFFKLLSLIFFIISAFVFVLFSVFLLRVRMPEWVSQAASGGGGD